MEGVVHAPFTIVGVLEPSGTPNDRAIFINIEGFYLLDGHAKPVQTIDPYEQIHDRVNLTAMKEAKESDQDVDTLVHAELVRGE